MRLFGINIPDNKRVEIALTYFYGVGLTTSQRLLRDSKVDPDKRAKDLTPDEMNRIKNWIDKNTPVEGELRQLIKRNIQRLLARLRALGDGETTLVADLLEVLAAHAGRTRRAGRG